MPGRGRFGQLLLKREVGDGATADAADDARGPERLASDRCRAASRDTVPPRPAAGRPRAGPDHNGPRSWLPSPASANRRCVSTRSAWAPTITSGRASPSRSHSRSQRGKAPLDATMAFFEKPLRLRGTPGAGRGGRRGVAAARRGAEERRQPDPRAQRRAQGCGRLIARLRSAPSFQPLKALATMPGPHFVSAAAYASSRASPMSPDDPAASAEFSGRWCWRCGPDDCARASARREKSDDRRGARPMRRTHRPGGAPITDMAFVPRSRTARRPELRHGTRPWAKGPRRCVWLHHGPEPWYKFASRWRSPPGRQLQTARPTHF